MSIIMFKHPRELTPEATQHNTVNVGTNMFYAARAIENYKAGKVEKLFVCLDAATLALNLHSLLKESV